MQELTRRSLIGKTINVLTSLLTGTVAVSVGTYLLGKPKDKQAANEWTDSGEVPDLRPNSPQEIKFEHDRVDGWKVNKEQATAWVVLDNHGKLAAFSPLCTHLGCAYHWQAKEKAFVCPCHGSQFGLNGDVLIGPASRPLDRLNVKVEANRLWLGFPQGSGEPT